MLLGAMLSSQSSAYCADLVIEAPTFVTGDTWEFSGLDNGKPYQWSREIIEVMPDARLRVKVVRNGKESIEIYDRWMNFLVDGRTDRARLLAKYPLAKEAKWQYTISFGNPSAGTNGEAKVVAEEHITVPMGSYDCLKVESSTSYRSGLYTTYDRTTRWHCPQVKWIAKEVYDSRTFSPYNPAQTTNRLSDTELVRFTSGK